MCARVRALVSLVCVRARVRVRARACVRARVIACDIYAGRLHHVGHGAAQCARGPRRRARRRPPRRGQVLYNYNIIYIYPVIYMYIYILGEHSVGIIENWPRLSLGGH